MQVLSAILENCRGLINPDRLHMFLLRAYSGREDWKSAYYYAASLAHTAQDETLRLAGTAHLLTAEDRLRLPLEQRLPLTAAAAAKHVQYAGRNISLGKLAEELRGAGERRENSAGGPGRYLGTQPQDGCRTFDARNFEDYEKYANPKETWQPLEPLITPDAVYLSSPFRTWCWQPAGKGWIYEHPLHHTSTADDNHDYDMLRDMMISFNGACDGSNVFLSANSGNGRGTALRALSPEGQLLWDSALPLENDGWRVIGAPLSAFGRLFTLTAKSIPGEKHNQDYMQIAFAEVDRRSGLYVNIVPLQQLKNITKMNYSGRLVCDGTSIYGIAGAGVFFKINAGSRQPEWLTAVPIHDSEVYYETFYAAERIGVFADTVVTYHPYSGTITAVNTQDGKIRWRRDFNYLRFLHSDVSSGQIVFSEVDSDHRTLTSLDVRTGQMRWCVPTAGVSITGEGVLQQNKIYIPCKDGIAVFSAAGGKLETILPLAETPLKIRCGAGRWAVLTENNLHVFADGENFEGGKISAVSPAPAAAPAAEAVAPANSAAMPPLAEIYPREVLPFPNSSDFSPEFVPLAAPGYFALCENDTLSIYRQGGYRPDGGYTPTEVLAASFYPYLDVSPDYFATHSGSTAEFYALPDRRPAFRYRALESDGVTSCCHKITGALVNDKLGLIVCANRRMLVVDLAAGKIVNTLIGGNELEKIIFFDRRFLVFQEKTGDYYRVTAAEPLTGKILWQLKETKAIWRAGTEYLPNGETTPYFAAFESGKTSFMSAADGKIEVLDYEVSDRTYFNGGCKIGNRFYFENGVIIDWERKKRIEEKTLITLDSRIKPGSVCYAVYQSDEEDDVDTITEIVLATPEKEIKFKLTEEIPGYKPIKLFDSAPVARQYGEKIYIVLQEWLYVCDTAGKLIECKQLFSYGIKQDIRFIDGGLLVWRDHGKVYLFTGPQQNSPAAFTQISSVPGGDPEWPEEDWMPYTELTPEFWHCPPNTPTAGYAYRIGCSRGKVYIELRAPAPDGENQTWLQATLTASNKSAALFYERLPLFWNLDGLAECSGGSELAGKLRSRRKTLPDGTRRYLIIIDKSVYSDEPETDNAPILNLNLELRTRGVLRARAQAGGLADVYACYFCQPPFNIVQGQKRKDFLLREKLYRNANGFIPQGEALLDWLTVRRTEKGCEDNLAFLQEMLQRNTGFPAAANILSAMVIEKMALYRRDHPEVAATAPEYAAQALAISQELKITADRLQINPAYSERGLTFIFGNLVRHCGHNVTRIVGECSSRYRNKWFMDNDVTAAAPTVREHGMLSECILPFGLFSGHIKPDNALYTASVGRIKFFSKEINSFYFQEKPIALAGWHLISPAGDTLLLDNAAQELPRVSINKMVNRNLLNAVSGLRQVNIKDWGGFDLKDSITFPPPPKEYPTIGAKSLLLALETLPSGNNFALELADDYADAAGLSGSGAGKTPEEIYRMVLHRMTSEKNIRNAALQLQKIYQKNGDDLNAACRKIGGEFKAIGLSRDFQQDYFTSSNNWLERPDGWKALGPFVSILRSIEHETPPLDISPRPEAETAPLSGKYTVRGKEYAFAPVSNPFKSLVREAPGRKTLISSCPTVVEWCNNDRAGSHVYLAAAVNSPAACRAHLFIHGDFAEYDRIEITLWYNQRWLGNVRGIGKYSGLRYSLPVELAAGRGLLLLKLEYIGRPPFQITIGDENGIPLKDVEICQ